MSNIEKPKIIVILGPTSSGKSEVAIQLAKKFGGEIISADSRQIYLGMDIGTGKIEADKPAEIPQEFTNSKFYAGSRQIRPFFSQNIPHYGIDIVSPKTEYNAAKFKKYADKVIEDILRRGKLPIICGGTGFWIKAVIDNANYPEVMPDWVLRNKLRNKPAEELFTILKKIDPNRAITIDKNNPVRLIRAIEICHKLGKVPQLNCHAELDPASLGSLNQVQDDRHYDFLQIGLNLPKEKLHQNIKKRLRKRFNSGMIEEIKKLHYKNKISWKRLASFGLGYKLIPDYLKGKITSRKELFEKIYQAEKDYAKRQMTWFKKDKRIVWLGKYPEIEKNAKLFLNKKASWPH